MYRPRIAWATALAVSAMALVMAIVLLDRVLETGPISYALGGWAAPWGIEYRIDTVNAFVLVIVSAISTIVLPFARHLHGVDAVPHGPSRHRHHR
jgi:multicomponent Na+:H+ antiporter subunit D